MADKKRSTKDPARKIARLLVAIEEKMDSEVKCTIGDYIRLLQAQEEFDREMQRVWLDPGDSDSPAGLCCDA